MFLLVFLLTYSVTSIFCFFIDTLSDYRLEKKTRPEIVKDYNKMMPNVLTNLVLSIPVIKYIEYLYLNTNFTTISENLFINLFLWMLLCDLIFYTNHRLLHTRSLFFIHKTHHEFSFTYGAGAIYAHPLDFVFANLFPIGIPFIVFNIPYLQCLFITFFSSFLTVFVSHGGYFPNQSHLLHHKKKMVNYGLFYTDRLFNTYLSKE